MTERVDILFGQALDKAVPETWTTLDADQLNRLKDKFAELIVQECLNVLYANGLYEYDISEVLCDHFGIEE